MNRATLYDFIHHVFPANSPYYAALRGCLALREPVPLAERLAIGLNDPRIVWNVANAHFRTGTPYPKPLDGYWFRETRKYLEGDHANLALAQAHALTFRANQRTCNVVQALLICADCKLEDIAHWTGLEVSVIRAFDQVFFNVRDRFEDRPCITALVYPKGRVETQKPGYLEQETEQQLLLRLAFEHGYREVLYQAGITPQRLEGGVAVSAAAEVEAAIMESARTQVRQGAVNASDVPVLKRAQALLVAARKTAEPQQLGDAVMGLGALGSSLGLSLSDELRRHKADEIAMTLNVPETPAAKDRSRPFAFLKQESEAPAKN